MLNVKRMRLLQLTKVSALAFVVLLPTWLAAADVPTAGARGKSETIASSKRTGRPCAISPARQQKWNSIDQIIAVRIRQSILADRSLSAAARSTKIVSQCGTVALEGSVGSEAEVKALVRKAMNVIGATGAVICQLAVTPAAKL